MASLKPTTRLQTHEVINQPPVLENINLYNFDAALNEAVNREGGGWAAASLHALGERVGSAEVQEWAEQANRNPPQLRAFDRFGQRIDEVEFHPAYHRLMALGIEHGISACAWTADQGGHVTHSAMLYLMTLADPGVCCPMSMTYAVIPTLRYNSAIANEWEPRILAARYDQSVRPADEKSGVTLGMAMTEKQGGSDLRSNTTRATPLPADGAFELVGHKWFCSAPMSDAFLSLATTDAGLSCFLVPRWRPDGTRNAIQILRLKDKLGDRSNASSEIEYHGAWARLIGEPGHGIRTIIEMVQGTRLDCMIGSTALMRATLTHALWHCTHRRAFGSELIKQPAMAKVLADLVIEQEGAVAMSFRVARAFDDAHSSEQAGALARILTPIAKYWICKRAPGFVYEAMECLGGGGYVEESPLPRLFRQAPVNSIWEGSGNIIALDTLRALKREPRVLDALLAELEPARGADRYLDAKIESLKKLLGAGELDDASARYCVESMALACQGAILFKTAPSYLAEAFAETRLRANPSFTYGAFRGAIDTAVLISRASPAN